MNNYKVIVSYDGSRYKGWQRLNLGSKRTIQDILEKTLGEMIQFPVEIHGSGRTDAGVHARGQVFHMKIPFRLRETFIIEVNQQLPEDIRMLEIKKVSGNFHARYSAIGKRYCYYVDTKEKADVFLRKYSYHFPEKLDLEKMRYAAKILEGRHDFSSFTNDKTEGKDRIRTIYDIQIQEENGRLTFEYRGDGFLQHMVRILTGTLLEVGQGKIAPNEIQKILEKKERAVAGFLAPPQGLFLEEVYYEN